MPDPEPEITLPYRAGIDDIGGSDLLAPVAPADGYPIGSPENPHDPILREADYRRAVLALLTEIRDLLAANDLEEGDG